MCPNQKCLCPPREEITVLSIGSQSEQEEKEKRTMKYKERIRK
jgi:hypothetical protein